MTAMGRVQGRLRYVNVCLAATLLAAVCGSAIAADSSIFPTGKYMLAYKFNKGDELQHLLTMNTEIIVKLPARGDKEGKRTQQTSRTKTWIFSDVLSVDESGSAVMLKKLANYQMETVIGRPGVRLVESANEKKVTVTIGGRLVPTEQAPVSLSESMHDLLFVQGLQVTVTPSGKVSAPQGTASLSQTERVLADNLVADQLGVVLPEKSIRVGEEWTYKQEINTLQGPVTLDTKCKLASIEIRGGERYAQIACDRSATILGDKTKPNEPHATIAIKCDVEFAVDRGFLQKVEFVIKQDVDGAGKGPSVETTIRGKLEKKRF